MSKVTAWAHLGEQDKTPLHYTACGLDDVYLLGGYVIEKTPFGEGLAIKNLDQLLIAIGCYLAKERKALSNKELRFMRKQMDLTQSELAKLLGLGSQQVARWEKAECEISGPAELLLRACFIQHAGGKLDLQNLASTLEDMDAPVDERMSFEKTSKGWKPRKAA